MTHYELRIIGAVLVAIALVGLVFLRKPRRQELVDLSDMFEPR